MTDVAARKRYEDLFVASHSEFDRVILTVSSGAFGVSLVYIEKIAPLKLASAKWILPLGWFALAIAVAFSLASYLVAAKANLIEIERGLRPANPKPAGKEKSLHAAHPSLQQWRLCSDHIRSPCHCDVRNRKFSVDTRTSHARNLPEIFKRNTTRRRAAATTPD